MCLLCPFDCKTEQGGEIPGRADAFPSSRAPLPTLSSSALKGSHSAAAEKEEGSSFAVVSGQLSEIHACSPARRSLVALLQLTRVSCVTVSGLEIKLQRN